MNVPGTDEGNWTWRAAPGAFDAALSDKVRGLVSAADRLA
jgi:4-alpha-glucanotransferase